MSDERAEDLGRVTVERQGQVLLIGIDRESKRNALSPEVLRGLGQAYGQYEADDELRCAVVFGHGSVFSAGADLTRMRRTREQSTADDPASLDPFQLRGPLRTKPMIAAVHGVCFGAGLEIALAADIIIAAEGARLGQPEVSRGLFAFAGGAVRLPQRIGWGNAQRWLLTGEPLSAEEAYRIGLAQELVSPDSLLDRAVELAQAIAASAPIGVRDTLAVGRIGQEEGSAAAFARMLELRAEIFTTADVKEGMAAFVERRPAQYVGA